MAVRLNHTIVSARDSADAIESKHYAFLANEDEFDEIFARGVYFDDPNGHLLEVITRPYGSGGTTSAKVRPLFASNE